MTEPVSTGTSVVEEGLFAHRFEVLAVEMGEQLRATALSTNVKERLDFSCGVLDADGRLVVNAPHIPVHLGALGLCVREVSRVLSLGPGDAGVTNHPAFGGSHLPDVTVISPAHDDDGELLGWVASRAHHAEIGGTRPGSMPPRAARLVDEGVVIPPMTLVEAGKPRWDEMRRVLSTGPWPSRAVEENVADLAAALAANRRGVAGLQRLAAAQGADVVRGALDAITRRAARLVRGALAKIPAGVYRAEQRLDDGAVIAVTIERHDESLRVDFGGSSGVHPGNLNATPAVVRSAVLYVLRLLVDEPIPLNEGLLDPVELVVPTGMLAPEFPADPAAAPAVVGGNVETSQRIVDTLVQALELMACGQGTMNNVLFGDETFGYYETVAGGAGAGPGFDGASGVHTHMTNTRITDVEVLEGRFPVRLERFCLRRGSGGSGRWLGGDGIIREITFLRPLSLSIVSQHRRERPFGVAGGEPGALGEQELVRSDGTRERLEGIDEREVGRGDRLVVRTPGGGGWGSAEGGA